MNAEHQGELKQLTTRYAGLRPDASVAFIDESYRLAGEGREEPFYLMAAVMLPMESSADIRDDLYEIADGGYWHTIACTWDAHRNRSSVSQRTVHHLAGTMRDIDKDLRSIEKALGKIGAR